MVKVGMLALVVKYMLTIWTVFFSYVMNCHFTSFYSLDFREMSSVSSTYMKFFYMHRCESSLESQHMHISLEHDNFGTLQSLVYYIFITPVMKAMWLCFIQ